jgi:UDP-N-acetylglucosamine 2-epimerase (non-hydrolysing)
VGTKRERIVAETHTLLNNAKEYQDMAQAVNPYGDGTTCTQVVDILKKSLNPGRK